MFDSKLMVEIIEAEIIEIENIKVENIIVIPTNFRMF